MQHIVVANRIKAFAISNARINAGIFPFSAKAIDSVMLIIHSCRLRFEVKPFCPLDRII
jgi:hypothetical protein